MGASASTDQGRPTGTHVRDVGSSDSEKQYDWSQSKQAEAKEEVHTLQEKLESYTIPDPLRPPLPQDWGFTTPPQNCNHYYLGNG